MSADLWDGGKNVSRQMTVTLPATGRAAHLEETAVLLVSELVGNVLRHARTRALAMALYLDAEVASLLIEVHDTDPHEPRPRTPETLDESGFGFVLIDALAGKWGVRQTEIGKAVWVELDARE